MSNESVSAGGAIYEKWHRFIHERDAVGLMTLYADDSVLESTAILVLEHNKTGVLKGKAALRTHFERFLAMLPPKPPHEWYRPGPAFIDNDTLLWEYPSEGPNGAQFDVVESMTLRDGLVVYHRVYWGWRSTQALLEKLGVRAGDED